MLYRWKMLVFWVNGHVRRMGKVGRGQQLLFSIKDDLLLQEQALTYYSFHLVQASCTCDLPNPFIPHRSTDPFLSPTPTTKTILKNCGPPQNNNTTHTIQLQPTSIFEPPPSQAQPTHAPWTLPTDNTSADAARSFIYTSLSETTGSGLPHMCTIARITRDSWGSA